jgi:hypothetical protein
MSSAVTSEAAAAGDLTALRPPHTEKQILMQVLGATPTAAAPTTYSLPAVSCVRHGRHTLICDLHDLRLKQLETCLRNLPTSNTASSHTAHSWT